MNPTQILACLNGSLPNIFVAINPKGVRELANRAGRCYAARIDEILTAYNDTRATFQTNPVREITFPHAGRTVIVYHARVAGYNPATDVPKTRMLALSVDNSCLEKPDSILETYMRNLKAAVEERGATADEILRELTGSEVKWDAAA